MFIRDYYHRTNAIDFQIELFLYTIKKWWKVTVYDKYYDHIWNPKKGSLKAKTKITFYDGTYFIPDAIIMLNMGYKMKLYAFELYNGIQTKRVLQQLQKHKISLQQGLLSITLNQKIGSKVLIVFDSKVAMDAVINRMSKDNSFSNFKNLFLFSTIDLLKSDFNSWYYFDRTKGIL